MRPKIRKDNTEAASVLAILRGIAPARQMSVAEARRVAELQATRLLLMTGVTELPVPAEVVTCQSRVVVEYDFEMPDSASGACHWDRSRGVWVVTINAHHAETRQRFTLLHEYKHILDHGQPQLLEPVKRSYYGLPAAEFVSDYFAGCVLMPRTLVLRAWNAGQLRTQDLALRFDVSERAMEVRLSQLKLGPAAAPHGRHGSQQREAA